MSSCEQRGNGDDLVAAFDAGGDGGGGGDGGRHCALRPGQAIVPAVVADDENVDAWIGGSIGDQRPLRLCQHSQAGRPRNALAQAVDRLGGPGGQVTIAGLADSVPGR